MTSKYEENQAQLKRKNKANFNDRRRKTEDRILIAAGTVCGSEFPGRVIIANGIRAVMLSAAKHLGLGRGKRDSR